MLCQPRGRSRLAAGARASPYDRPVCSSPGAPRVTSPLQVQVTPCSLPNGQAVASGTEAVRNDGSPCCPDATPGASKGASSAHSYRSRGASATFRAARPLVSAAPRHAHASPANTARSCPPPLTRFAADKQPLSFQVMENRCSSSKDLEQAIRREQVLSLFAQHELDEALCHRRALHVHDQVE
jgi:hypothetical protein